MGNFQYYCSFPVYCRNCQQMSTANLLAGIVDPPAPKRSFLMRIIERLFFWSRPDRSRPRLKERPTCGRCGGADIVPYDSEDLMNRQVHEVDAPELWDVRGWTEPTSKAVAKWNTIDRLGRDLVLTDGKYFCPRCKSFEMRFEDGKLQWD